MVGLLAVVIGASLSAASEDWPVPDAIWLLATGSAGAFAVIDLRYALPRTISHISLLDAAFEVALVVALSIAWSFTQTSA